MFFHLHDIETLEMIDERRAMKLILPRVHLTFYFLHLLAWSTHFETSDKLNHGTKN